MNLQYPFTLSGNTNNLWRQVTNNQWQNMLSKNWTDNGFHFYSQICSRGPATGINTPSDLQSEMSNGAVSFCQSQGGTVNRYQVKTNLLNTSGQRFTFFYDYDSAKAICQLVTCSYT